VAILFVLLALKILGQFNIFHRPPLHTVLSFKLYFKNIPNGLPETTMQKQQNSVDGDHHQNPTL
jgi:hypothetical protein